jgi:hypothetical protein
MQAGPKQQLSTTLHAFMPATYCADLEDAPPSTADETWEQRRPKPPWIGGHHAVPSSLQNGLLGCNGKPDACAAMLNAQSCLIDCSAFVLLRRVPVCVRVSLCADAVHPLLWHPWPHALGHHQHRAL